MDRPRTDDGKSNTEPPRLNDFDIPGADNSKSDNRSINPSLFWNVVCGISYILVLPIFSNSFVNIFFSMFLTSKDGEIYVKHNLSLVNFFGWFGNY